MDNKIKRMDIFRWILAAIVGYLIVIVIILLTLSITDSIAMKKQGITEGAIWEWDMKQVWAISGSHGEEYSIAFFIYLGFAILGLPIWLLQSGYSLIPEDGGIACRTFGKVTKIGYREISDVASISVPHARNGCLSMLATVFPPLAMYSCLKITGAVRNAKGIYKKVTIRYFYVDDPRFTAIQIRNKMGAAPPPQQ